MTLVEVALRMSEDSDRFRSRAKQCRQLAKDARDEDSRRTLSDSAEDLEAEADQIDADEAREAGEG